MIREQLQRIIDEIAQWDGVTTHPHRFGGVEFNLGKVEIGHLHQNGMVDIPFTVRIREQLVGAGEAGLHHLLQDSGWITVFVRSAADADQALRLYRLSYLHKRYRKPSDRRSGQFKADLTALGFNSAINGSVYGETQDS